MGRFRSPECGVKEAKLFKFPLDNVALIPDKSLNQCQIELMLRSRTEKANDRWLSEMNADMLLVMKEKDLAFFAYLLQHFEYPDIHLFDDISRGFGLVGKHTPPHFFAFERCLVEVAVDPSSSWLSANLKLHGAQLKDQSPRDKHNTSIPELPDAAKMD